MIRFLASVRNPMVVLGCYLVWYVVMVCRYFDPSPRLWLNSLGISAIIGTALYLSTAYDGGARRPMHRLALLRLYMMPFCVSSFAALIKDRDFIWVFDSNLGGNAWATIACLAWVALVLGARRLVRASEAGPRLPASST